MRPWKPGSSSRSVFSRLPGRSEKSRGCCGRAHTFPGGSGHRQKIVPCTGKAKKRKRKSFSVKGVTERNGKRKCKKKGIMGGTFDPIHIGHLILGENACLQLGLDSILFMPSGNPPHKPHRPGRATTMQRVEMVRLAIEDNPF